MSSIKTNWNLDLLYKSKDDPKMEEDFLISKEIYDNFSKNWAATDLYLSDEDALLQALNEYEKLVEIPAKPYMYFALALELDNSNEEIQAKYNRYTDLYTKLANQVEFFENRLSKITATNQQKFLKSEKLKKYHRMLSRIFQKSKHILSEDEEKIINLLHKPAIDNWNSLLEKQIGKIEVNTLTDKNKIEKVNFSQLLNLMNSTKKEVRDNAAKNLYKKLRNISDIAVEEFNTYLETSKISRELRGYKSYDEGRHLKDDISSEIVNNLIKTVSANKEITHKFFELKANLFKVDKIKYYERNVPFLLNKEETRIPFEEAVKIVEKSLKSIEPQFSELFIEMLEKGQIDVFPKKNKSPGGFCTMGAKDTPIFILMNYTDKISDVLTLAHETGHAVHHSFFNKYQPEFYASASLATAEVSSTIFEEFVFDGLVKEMPEVEKFELKLDKVTGSMNSIFRQVSFYKMEQEFHKEFEKENRVPLTKLNEIFRKHSEEELGPNVEVIKGADLSWIYISHFRRNFYVYSYASGELIARSLKETIKNEKSAGKLIEFMKAGKSKTTFEIFKDVGIDLSDTKFFQKGIDQIKDEVDELYQLAQKLNLI